MDRRMDIWTYGRTDERIDEGTNVWTDGWRNGRIDGRTDGGTDVLTDNVWTDVRMERSPSKYTDSLKFDTYTQHAKNTRTKCTMAGTKMSGVVLD